MFRFKLRWPQLFRQRTTAGNFDAHSSDLPWRVCGRCPQKRTEPAAIKVGRYFFIAGGYASIERVVDRIDVLDLETQVWGDPIPLPHNVAQTHAGIASGEERFVYFAGGQLGPHCSPAVADCFALDIHTGEWTTLPSLPEARYGPVAGIWHGRLHVMSGAKPDRFTSACDHWSIAVQGGKALEPGWRRHVALPRGGPHRGGGVLRDHFYLFGGQDGDTQPIAGDPEYRCNWESRAEVLYPDCFVLREPSGRWQTIASMLCACTHVESTVTTGSYAILAGGNKKPSVLSDFVQVYDSAADRWRIAGKTPYPMKTSAVYHNNWLYLIAGQRSVSDKHLAPGEILDTVWGLPWTPAG